MRSLLLWGGLMAAGLASLPAAAQTKIAVAAPITGADAVFGLQIRYSHDAPGLDGTLGAIRRALPLLE